MAHLPAWRGEGKRGWTNGESIPVSWKNMLLFWMLDKDVGCSALMRWGCELPWTAHLKPETDGRRFFTYVEKECLPATKTLLSNFKTVGRPYPHGLSLVRLYKKILYTPTCRGKCALSESTFSKCSRYTTNSFQSPKMRYFRNCMRKKQHSILRLLRDWTL